jgi:TolB-like protein
MRISVSLLLLLALAGSARAASMPTVAVMPFKDLAGGRGAIGEAIRETVTSDLRDVGGLKVVERSFIDKVLAEQNLQARKTELDPSATVAVGRLLGASLLVTGAYQRAGQVVRLTARFVDVETGQIVGSAKVDGPEVDFLELQDRVTAELLRSAKIEKPRVQKFAARRRPKLKNLKAVEIYGDAVVAVDPARKKELLEQALAQEPDFVYASRDLDALARRLREYEAIRAAESSVELKALLEALRKETDPQKQGELFFRIYPKLTSQRRWVLLESLSRELLAKQPPPTFGSFDLEELLRANLVTSASMQQEHDRVLREGDAFLARYPTGMQFGAVKSLVESSLKWKREVEEGKTKGPAAVAALDPMFAGEPCRVALEWLTHKQLAEARREFEKCVVTPSKMYPPTFAIQMLVTVTTQQGDVKAARGWLAKLEQADPKLWETMKSYEWQWAADR